MADGKISSMVVATETKTTDLFEISQQVGGVGSERVTRANDLQSIALFLHDVMQNSALTTTEKTLVGAINELVYKPGDTFTMKAWTQIVNGIITNGKRSIEFFIPSPKPISATSASITGNLLARGTKGYVNGTTASTSTYNLANLPDGVSLQTDIRPNGIYFKLVFATALSNADDNTPVGMVNSTALTVTFN